MIRYTDGREYLHRVAAIIAAATGAPPGMGIWKSFIWRALPVNTLEAFAAPSFLTIFLWLTGALFLTASVVILTRFGFLSLRNQIYCRRATQVPRTDLENRMRDLADGYICAGFRGKKVVQACVLLTHTPGFLRTGSPLPSVFLWTECGKRHVVAVEGSRFGYHNLTYKSDIIKHDRFPDDLRQVLIGDSPDRAYSACFPLITVRNDAAFTAPEPIIVSRNRCDLTAHQLLAARKLAPVCLGFS